MSTVNLKNILALHCDIIDASGGTKEILNEDMLESAIYSIDASFSGRDLYPTIQEKAAALCFHLCNDHAFRDGNKRVGVISMLQLLEEHDCSVCSSDKDLIDLGFSVAEHKMEIEDIVCWIKEREVVLDRKHDLVM